MSDHKRTKRREFVRIIADILGAATGAVVAVLIGADPWHAFHAAAGAALGVWVERYWL